MREVAFKTVLFILLSFSAAWMGCRPSSGFEEILRLLPAASDVPGWTSPGEPQTAAGDDLYLLIDGGAETYLRHGFRRAAIHSYEHTDGKMFNLEIYEMTDPAAADSIFVFKIGSDGKSLDIGDEARLESYYLNLKKGRYIVTVIGLDTSETTRQTLIQTARIVESRIKNQPDTAGATP